MLELDTSRLGPLTDFDATDVERWASLGRTPPVFASLLHAAMCAQLLRSGLGGSLGGDVSAGLAREETSVILELAAHRPADDMQREAKRLALSSWASSDPGDLLGAIVRAALAHDARRAARRRSPVPRSTPPGRPSFSRSAGRVVASTPGPHGTGGHSSSPDGDRRRGRRAASGVSDDHRAKAPAADASLLPAYSDERTDA